MWAPGASPEIESPPGDFGRDVAVIDVGSNSVRLVLYRVEGRAIWTVHNEKVLAGLGRTLTQTGRLAPDGAAAALAAIRRFRAVLDGARPAELLTAATAAVREAIDGPSFVERVRRETGLALRVLSGAEEARLSGLGVLAGQPDAAGVVGDLGGSSLELIRLSEGRAEGGATLPLGPFALGAPAELDRRTARDRIARRLEEVARLYRGDCFFAVGGAWRNIVLIQMETANYPLRMLHQYELTARDAVDAARFVARQSRASLERMPGVSKKRAETLPYAATLLEALVEQLEVQRICMSAFGLREGLILDAMPKALRELDPLIEGCAMLGLRFGIAERLGAVLQQWLTPLWDALPPLFARGRDEVLLAAACRLADLGARLHPEHRADLAFDQVLRAPIPGQSHAERAFLASAVFARHTAQAPFRLGSGMDRVLSPERLRRAQALGAAMRLGCDLSGRAPALLTACALRLIEGGLVLTAGRAAADLMLGEQTRERLLTLADALEVEGRIEIA